MSKEKHFWQIMIVVLLLVLSSFISFINLQPEAGILSPKPSPILHANNSTLIVLIGVIIFKYCSSWNQQSLPVVSQVIFVFKYGSDVKIQLTEF